MILKYKNTYPKIDKSCFIAPSADIIGDVSIAKDASVWFGVVIRGDVHSITIGERTNIQDLSMIHVTHYKNDDKSTGHPTVIEHDVTIAHKVMLHGCTIKAYSMIGMSATILDGAIINEESIVGANALVTKNKHFPPRSLILGNPAKVARTLTDEEITELHKSATRYVGFAKGYK